MLNINEHLTIITEEHEKHYPCTSDDLIRFTAAYIVVFHRPRKKELTIEELFELATMIDKQNSTFRAYPCTFLGRKAVQPANIEKAVEIFLYAFNFGVFHTSEEVFRVFERIRPFEAGKGLGSLIWRLYNWKHYAKWPLSPTPALESNEMWLLCSALDNSVEYLFDNLFTAKAYFPSHGWKAPDSEGKIYRSDSLYYLVRKDVTNPTVTKFEHTQR